MAEDSGEKQHSPTERRLREAAAQGNVRRSADLPKAVAIIVALLIASASAAAIGGRIQALLAVALSQCGTASPSAAMGWMHSFIALLAPFLALIIGLATASALFTGGWVFSLQTLQPDFSKISVGHGLEQVVSTAAAIETSKSLLKFIIIGGAGALLISQADNQFLALLGGSQFLGTRVLQICLAVIWGISLGVILPGVADAGLQTYLHRQKLRMSDSELRDEMKEAVGNPHVRQRQRALARRMARARQMRRVAEASVIITNPTHFAVAIRYRRGVDGAPIMLAKGVGLLAAEITSRARGYGIPVVEAPPVARAIYRHVEPGEQIPVALYRACAEILAYVWRMQHWRSTGGVRPTPPKPLVDDSVLKSI